MSIDYSIGISIDTLVETSTDYSIGISIDALGQALMRGLNMLTKLPRSMLLRCDLDRVRCCIKSINAHGIADLCYRTHILYPDLVRQVLASAVISYKDPDLSTFENASFSFLANEKYCSLSLEKLTEIYELAEERKDIAFPRNFNPTQAIWDLMATGEFKSHSAS